MSLTRTRVCTKEAAREKLQKERENLVVDPLSGSKSSRVQQLIVTSTFIGLNHSTGNLQQDSTPSELDEWNHKKPTRFLNIDELLAALCSDLDTAPLLFSGEYVVAHNTLVSDQMRVRTLAQQIHKITGWRFW